MSDWIITRTTGKTTRFRAASGHLTDDFERAQVFQNANAATANAHEGDVVQQRCWFALARAFGGAAADGFTVTP